MDRVRGALRSPLVALRSLSGRDDNVISLEDMGFRYIHGHEPVLSNIMAQISLESRIAIVGDNGDIIRIVGVNGVDINPTGDPANSQTPSSRETKIGQMI